ncbi:MAG: hypothetical protein M0002_08525 [Rhodospirillales bacterium]|nr:hypothetical protein [Rhodospirillales bacterium]
MSDSAAACRVALLSTYDLGRQPFGLASAATQIQASDTTTYAIAPSITGPYATLPAPNTGGAHMAPSGTSPPPFATLTAAGQADCGLPSADLYLLTVGASGLKLNGIDTRVAHATSLPGGPFQLSPGIADYSFTGDAVHRFLQMWQQTDCAVTHVTTHNPTGCNMNLHPWVAVTVRHGQEDQPQPSPFTDETTDRGGSSMGFYNMTAGDVSFFRKLASAYTIEDNFHQSVMGGTAADSIMLGAGDLYRYSDGNGNPMTPPAGQITNPTPGTNNWYATGGYPEATFAECSDPTQPDVAPVLDYLQSLPYRPSPNCLPGYYYMVDNHRVAYPGNGTLIPPQSANSITPLSSTPTIADVVLAHGVSWTFFGEGFNAYLANPRNPPSANVYWPFTNPFQFESAIMTNTAVRTADLQDTTALYSDIRGQPAAGSFVRQAGQVQQRPPHRLDGCSLRGVRAERPSQLQANSELRRNAAIVITFDESDGDYGIGLIRQPDFFGDGRRIPVIVVSYYSKGGRVVHTYTLMRITCRS